MTTASPPLLQPLPFRLLLDEAVRRVRGHFRRIYPAVAIPLALVSGAVPLAQGVFFRRVLTPGGPPETAHAIVGLVAFLLVIVVFVVVSGLGYGALFAAAVDAIAGRPVSMARAWRFMVRPRVLGTALLAGVATVFGMLFCILPGLYVALIFSLTIPVMVEEDLYGTAALRRSAALARYNPRRALDDDPRFKVFLVGLVGTLLGYMVNLCIQFPLIILQQVIVLRGVAGGHKPDPGELMAQMAWIQVPSSMVSVLTNTAMQLYVCFGIALLFFDVKHRKEGLDLEAAVRRLVETHEARRHS